MAIQIPKIQADQTQDQLHAPRVQAPGLNVEAPMEKQQSALEGAADQVVRVQNELAYQQADTTAQTRRNAFLTWDKQKRYGDPTSNQAGIYERVQNGEDPQKVYNDYTQERNQKLLELSKPEEGNSWSDMTQKMVNRRLNRADEETMLETLTQYGHQKAKYDKSQDDGTIMLARQAMPFASSQIVPGVASSFGPMDAQIANIRNTLMKQYSRLHMAQQNPNGEFALKNEATGQVEGYDLTNAARADMNSTMGRALSETMENLINSGALDKAKAFREKYGTMIDQYDNGQLDAKMKKADTEEQAGSLAGKLKEKSPDEWAKALADEPEDVRHKTLQFLHDDKAHVEESKRLQQQQFGDILAKKVIQYKQQNPTAQESDLEAQPWFKAIESKVSLPQATAARKFVSSSKTTDPVAFHNSMQILSGQDPQIDPTKLTADQALQILSTAGKDPAGEMIRKRLESQALPTVSQQNADNSFALSQLKQAAFRSGLITPDNDNHNDVQKGGDQDKKLGKLVQQYMQDTNGEGTMPREKRSESINQWVQKQTEQKPSTGWFGGLFGGQTKVTAPPVPVQNDLIGKAIKAWQQQNGSNKRPNKDELRQFIQENQNQFKGAVVR